MSRLPNTPPFQSAIKSLLFFLFLLLPIAAWQNVTASNLLQPQSVPPRQGTTYQIFLPIILKSNPIPTSTPTPVPTSTPTKTLTPTPIPTNTPTPTPTPTVLNQNFGINNYGGGNATWVTLGSKWHRGITVEWSSIEATEGTYNWDALNNALASISNNNTYGLTSIVRVWELPAWARVNGGADCGPIKTAKMTAFGNFMYELTKRLSAAPYNVRYIEIWSEPDVDSALLGDPNNSYIGCWGDDTDPYYGGGKYGDMLAAVYPRIKQANSNAKVLVGGLLSYCNYNVTNGCANNIEKTYLKFFEGILRRSAGTNDGGNYLDGVNFTAYDFYYGVLGEYRNTMWGSTWNNNGPVVKEKVRFFKNRLQAYGINPSSKLLISSESTIVCYTNQTDCSGNLQTTLAYYIPQLFSTALSEGITTTVYYPLYTSADFGVSALLDNAQNPRPSYWAYYHASRILNNAVYQGEITNYPNLAKGYRFIDSQNRTLWVIWPLEYTAAATNITLPSVPSSVISYNGSVLPNTQTFDLQYPVYVYLP
ncbi:MAG TPA: hypothetical protein PK299_09705 [Anaerolineales bacterium]|nr:hypothetical protein [Anaerolineales bacterium]